MLPYLTEREIAELDQLTKPKLWEPLAGPQTEALNTPADITFYGGAAGGGKTDLAIGLALTKHIKTLIMRREAPQLQGIFDRMTEILGSRTGFNSQDKIWRLPDRQVEFGSAPHPGDETKYQGRPHDLLVFDEITHFLEKQVRFMMGWLRTTTKGQRTRALFTGNPPTDSNGDWVISFFAPWLDNKHPRPAKPGELRWFAVIEGEDVEVDGPESFERKGQNIIPQSRTFIPSLVTDNPYLMDTGYITRLQAMPEPLRSQMLYGDFSAGRTDGEWQVIPTKWVDDAMERWRKYEHHDHGPMQAMGVDVARGGEDNMIMAPRRGQRVDELITVPGHEVSDGQTGASLVIKHMESGCVPLVDLIGWGASCFDHLDTFGVPAIALNGAESDRRNDVSGKLKFTNKRSYWHWLLRDLLDPRNGFQIQLPPDPELKADLCAPEYKFTVRGIQVESKDDIKRRIGRSPDKGDGVIYAFAEDVSGFVDAGDDEYYNDHFEGRSSLTGY